MWWMGGLLCCLFLYAIWKAYGEALLWWIPWWQIHNMIRTMAWCVVVILAIIIIFHAIPGGSQSSRLNGNVPHMIAR